MCGEWKFPEYSQTCVACHPMNLSVSSRFMGVNPRVLARLDVPEFFTLSGPSKQAEVGLLEGVGERSQPLYVAISAIRRREKESLANGVA